MRIILDLFAKKSVSGRVYPDRHLIANTLVLETLEDRVTPSGLPFTEMIVFGDSLSDAGNTFLASGYQIPTSPPYFEGRFSNGEIWSDYLAKALYLPEPTPWNVDSGGNYAYAGARTNDGFSIGGAPNIGTQIDVLFWPVGTPSPMNGDELIAIWGGANNFFDLSPTATPSDIQNLITTTITDIAGDITRLALGGGRHFLVPNVPPIGLTPYLQSFYPPEFGTAINQAVYFLNQNLSSTLETLETQLSALSVSIYQVDVFSRVCASNPPQIIDNLLI